MKIHTGNIRIAMRENGVITWLLSDHLDSTSVTADGSGALLTSLKYTAYGEIRTGNSLTDYLYTGQRAEAEIGLYFYNTRFYDAQLARFISADTVIPEPGSVKAYDRFSYVNGNPINFNDPSGHKACDDEYGCITKKTTKTNKRPIAIYTNPNLLRQDTLFSYVFRGSGSNGSWTQSDWKYYYSHRDTLYLNPSTWRNPDSEKGWDLFATHAERLSTHYSPTEKKAFVKDFSLLFAGIPYYGSVIDSLWASRHGPAVRSEMNPEIRSYLAYSNDGLANQYYDSINQNMDQSHHYVGSFYMSFSTDSVLATIGNTVRDINNPGDVLLGNGAASDAEAFSTATDLSIIGDLIRKYKN